MSVAAKAAAIVGERADPLWAKVAAKLYIPFSEVEQRHLDFDASMPREPLEGSTLGMLMYPSLDLPMTLEDNAFRGQHCDITIDRDASGRVKLTRKAL